MIETLKAHEILGRLGIRRSGSGAAQQKQGTLLLRVHIRSCLFNVDGLHWPQ